MRTAAALCLILLLALPGFAAKSTRRAASSGNAQTAAASKKSPARKSGVRTASSRRRGSGNGTRSARTVKSRQTWRTGQMTPTPERYKEIQQALVTKGYSSEPPDGVWGPQWVDSLKKFQQEQKLEPNGKLNSLSLRTLGLGPRREANALPAPVPSAAAGSAEPVTRELP